MKVLCSFFVKEDRKKFSLQQRKIIKPLSLHEQFPSNENKYLIIARVYNKEFYCEKK